MSLSTRISTSASTETSPHHTSSEAGTTESLFKRVARGAVLLVPVPPVSTPAPPPAKEAPEPTAFSSYVEHVIRFGQAPKDPENAETTPVLDSTYYDSPEDPDWEKDFDEESFIKDYDEELEEFDAAPEIVDGIQEAPPPSSFALIPPPPEPTPNLVQSSSSEQKGDERVIQIVDELYRRMEGIWGDPKPTPSIPESSSKGTHLSAPIRSQQMLLAENKREIAKVIRSEVPRAMKGELVTLLRTEIMRAVRGAIMRVIREEFESLHRLIEKMSDHISALEPRLAKLEGSLDKEIAIKFPEGMVKIYAPVTVPEREVKVAAPINVQPPSITFEAGAITSNFHKDKKGKREIKFERDGHQQIQSAEIIDGSPRH